MIQIVKITLILLQEPLKKTKDVIINNNSQTKNAYNNTWLVVQQMTVKLMLNNYLLVILYYSNQGNLQEFKQKNHYMELKTEIWAMYSIAWIRKFMKLNKKSLKKATFKDVRAFKKPTKKQWRKQTKMNKSLFKQMQFFQIK